MKPRLAARSKPVVTLDEEATTARPALSAGASSVVAVTPKSATKAIKRGTNAIVKIVASFVLLLVVLYGSLAATLMVAAPSADGFTWVVRGSFVGGIPEQGDFIYASTSHAVGTDAISKLTQAVVGVDNAAVFEVVTGPFNNIATDNDGQILVDGEPSGYFGEVEETKLARSYLAACVQGACDEGTFVIVPHDNIAGEARGQLSLDGVGAFDSVRD